MKILHSADWHLGQRFFSHERREEHAAVLTALLDIIEREHIEVLIIAGDVFDSATPPNYAQQQYYHFLSQLQNSPCQHVVIIAGNHDSPSYLNAPKSLLAAFNIHVIASISYDADDKPDLNQLILPLRDKNSDLLCVVAALPFLRDRELRYAQLGESAEDKRRQIQTSIANYYQLAAELVRKYQAQDVPLIATGHLFAHGGNASDSERHIHVGNLGEVSARIFDPVFDYVALGHLHRAQKISDTVYYSGSLLPMHFSQKHQVKTVNVVDFSNKTTDIKHIPLPAQRQLLKLVGKRSEILDKMAAWQPDADIQAAWGEVVLTEAPGIDISAELKAACADKALDIVKISLQQKTVSTDKPESVPRLQDLEPEALFLRCCAEKNLNDEDTSALLSLFQQLYEEIEH